MALECDNLLAPFLGIRGGIHFAALTELRVVPSSPGSSAWQDARLADLLGIAVRGKKAMRGWREKGGDGGTRGRWDGTIEACTELGAMLSIR